jgi:hypothetical protein
MGETILVILFLGFVIALVSVSEKHRREIEHAHFLLHLSEQVNSYDLEYVVLSREKIDREDEDGKPYTVRQPLTAVINGREYVVGDRLGDTELWITGMSEGSYEDAGKYLVHLSLPDWHPDRSRASFSLKTSKARSHAGKPRSRRKGDQRGE